MTIRNWLLLGLLSLLWGSSFFLIGIAVKEISPLLLVFFRVLVAALFLWVIFFCFHKKLGIITLPIVIGVVVMGAVNNVIPFSLLTWGQSHIESGLAAILNATTPFFTMLIAHFFTDDDRFSLKKILGLLLALAGVISIFSPRMIEAGSDNTLALAANFEILPLLACLGAALSYGVSAVWGRRLGRLGVPPFLSALGMLSASSLLLSPVGFALTPDMVINALPSTSAILATVILGVVCTASAYLIFFRLLASAGATNTSLVTILVPVTALLLGVSFLGEQLKWQDFMGLIFIVGGLLTIDGRLWRQIYARARIIG